MTSIFSIAKAALKLILGKGTFTSYSHFGEDAIVHSLFRGQAEGFYVDVGAYHPHLYSNTYALYRRGWRGLAIDPNFSMKPLFRIFRPRDRFVCAGVGHGERKYATFKDGAYNSFVEGSGARLLSLAEILEQENVRRIDFLNVDAEGMDLEVLSTHNWGIKPKVIAVEAGQQSDIQKFLEEKGYQLVGIAGLTLIFQLR